MKKGSWNVFMSISLVGVIAYGLIEPYFPVDTNEDMAALLIQYVFGLIAFWIVSINNKPKKLHKK